MAADSAIELAQLKDYLYNLSSQLDICQEVYDVSWRLFLEAVSIGVISLLDSDNPYEWIPIVLYLSVLSRTEAKIDVVTGVSLSDMLNKVKVNCRDFLLKLDAVITAIQQPDHLVSYVKSVQRDYLIYAAIFHKFEKILKHVINDSQLDCSSQSEVVEKRKSIWLLFLILREKSMKNSAELIPSFYLLLCCMNHVLKSTASILLQRPYDSLVLGCATSTQKRICVLERLCEDFNADVADVVQLNQSKEVAEGLVQHGTLDNQLLTTVWNGLTKSRTINFVEFLNRESLLIPNSSSSSQKVPDTPVQTRLTTVQSLKMVINDFPDAAPSETLLRFFNICTDNPFEQLTLRLEEMKDRYVNAYINEYCSSDMTAQQQMCVPAERFVLVTKLYFRIMELLLQQEEKRLSQVDFSTLLHNETFHKTLLLCCALVISHTYSIETDSLRILTWLLNAFSVQAYDMCKVIECFIKAEPKLSKETIRFLQACENHILDSLAWSQHSPLFEVFCTTGNTAVSSFPPEHTRPATSPFLSPMRRRPPVENGHQPRSKSLEVFLNKACQLAYNRIIEICPKLEISSDNTQRIWTCMQYCIMHKPDLLMHRHLDQIMLCNIYGLCKVLPGSDLMLFKNINTAYDATSYSSGKQIYRKVFIDDKQGYKSIKDFYNMVFINAAGTYILSFSPGSESQPPIATAPRTGFSPLKASPQRVKRNIFVSPVKSGTSRILFSEQMTPRTKRLYCFGDSETSVNLHSVNALLQSANAVDNLDKANVSKPTLACSKRIKFEDQE